jgi:adenylate cyclase
MKKIVLLLLVTIGVIFSVMISYQRYPEFFMPFEYRIKDMMFIVRGEVKSDDRIVIVDIDEKSLKELGQWPWSRDKIAHLLENLRDYGVAIIGIDVVFAEPDNSSPKRVLAKLGMEHEGVIDFDKVLARSVADTPTILGYVFAVADDGISPSGSPKSQAIIIEKNKPSESYLVKPYRAILNIDAIQQSAYSSGYFNMIPDTDGIVRNVPLVMQYEGVIYPSLSLEMIRIAMEESRITIEYDERGVSHIALGDRIIPTDFFGRMMVNYHGPQKSYRYISATDVYTKKTDPAELEGKIVLLGTSSVGLLDLRSTPLDSAYPGVEVHANVLDNLLNSDFLSKPIWAVGVDQLSIVVLSVLTFGILLFSSAFIAFVVFLSLDIALIATHYYMMMHQGILLNTFLPLVAINAIFVIGQMINYFLEIRQKEMIKGKFASKVSPAVMNDILSSGDNVLAGTEREITIFFSDMRNFTNISEVLGNPKHLISLLNAYMDPMTEIIVKSGGTVDKFIGDAIMAYWNAPLNVENHADKAVEAALSQLHRLKPLNTAIRANPEFVNLVSMSDQKGVPIIDIGIGINTGPAVVGEMGSKGRSDYTVIGDTINLGSRLESLCKFYNSKLNVSEFTKVQLQEKYIFRFLDLVTVKGKHEPIEIWQIHDFDPPRGETLYSVSTEELKEELRRYHEAIALYKGALFDQALAIFREMDAMESKTNQLIYRIYIERCEHYLEFPPESFNGVFMHTTKG